MIQNGAQVRYQMQIAIKAAVCAPKRSPKATQHRSNTGPGCEVLQLFAPLPPRRDAGGGGLGWPRVSKLYPKGRSMKPTFALNCVIIHLA